jgi:hypothetical protein
MNGNKFAIGSELVKYDVRIGLSKHLQQQQPYSFIQIKLKLMYQVVYIFLVQFDA